MQLILAADHGGFQHKEEIKKSLQKYSFQVLDVGAASLDPSDDFPDFAAAAVKKWQEDKSSKILLCCRSGVGMMIAANRFPGIYCGLALTPKQVEAATRDDHLNALALASGYFDLKLQKALIEAFLQTPHSQEERFTRRLTKIDQLGKI